MFNLTFTDSGVKSSSQNEDEPPISPTSTSSDDVKRKRSILRKMSNISGVSLRSSPSTPLFDFPTFDELFETEGKQHMKLSMHQSKSGFLRQQSYPGPAVSVLGLVLLMYCGGGVVSVKARYINDKSFTRIISTKISGIHILVREYCYRKLPHMIDAFQFCPWYNFNVKLSMYGKESKLFYRWNLHMYYGSHTNNITCMIWRLDF